MKGFNEYSIEYKGSGEKSYLVVSVPVVKEVKTYQIHMMENNTIGLLLPLSAQRLNDDWKLYYDITSKIPLNRILERKALNAGEFEHLITQIIKIPHILKEYLLDSSALLLNKLHIYCDPASFDLSFLYLPNNKSHQPTDQFKLFLKELLVEDIRLLDDDSGALLKRLLEALKTENFNVNQLNHCIKTREKKQVIVEKKNSEREDLFEENKEIYKVRVDANQESIGKKPLNHYPLSSYLVTGLLNLIFLGILVTMMMSDMKDKGSSIPGLLLIAGAVNYFLFSRLFSKEKREEFIKEKPMGVKPPERYYVNKALHEDAVSGGSSKKDEKEPENSPRNRDNNLLRQNHFIGHETNLPSIPVISTSTIEQVGNNKIKRTQEGQSVSDKTMVLGEQQEQISYLQSLQCPSEKITLDKNSVFIGRLGDSVDYMIKNKAIGKIHAEIIKKDQGYYLIDLNSVNGSFINGERMVCNIGVLLRNGDKITFANEAYSFVQIEEISTSCQPFGKSI